MRNHRGDGIGINGMALVWQGNDIKRRVEEKKFGVFLTVFLKGTGRVFIQQGMGV